jgi:acetylornithine/N-succinyldiaminopimelate aminotransferase
MKPTSRERDFQRFVAQTSDSPLGVVVDKARGARIWDKGGVEYLDLLSGIGVANVGHCNPEVVAAIRDHASRYLHTFVYGEAVEEPQVELARRLAEIAPGNLSMTFFANSGTEAVEGALKLARKHTGRSALVAFRGGYHGDSMGSLSLCDNPVYRQPFEPLLPDVEFLPFDDLEALQKIDETVAAAVIEPVQSEGGVRIPSDGFLPALRERCRQTGALLVFDEVMTGFGRTGSWFAGEHWDVCPDIMVMAKALGGGLPLGGFISRPEIMRALAHDPPLNHLTTFGGHPLSCAAGVAALDYAKRNRLPERAAELGRTWLQRLDQLRGTVLREVRGCGMLLGLELASPEHTHKFCELAFERRLILNWTLHRDTVVRLAPPLIISDEETDHALGAIAEIVAVLE